MAKHSYNKATKGEATGGSNNSGNNWLKDADKFIDLANKMLRPIVNNADLSNYFKDFLKTQLRTLNYQKNCLTEEEKKANIAKIAGNIEKLINMLEREINTTQEAVNFIKQVYIYSDELKPTEKQALENYINNLQEIENSHDSQETKKNNFNHLCSSVFEELGYTQAVNEDIISTSGDCNSLEGE